VNKKRNQADTQPRFPYTISPAALRKLLKEIPDRPKPGKINLDTLKTWNVSNANEVSPIRVLKEIGFLGSSGEPLQAYVDFMQSPPQGPRTLGNILKTKYKELFETAHNPQSDAEVLKKFFNIHAGGSEGTINWQLQTFKALAEYADFSQEGSPALGVSATSTPAGDKPSTEFKMPPVNIDLHIHLPENKTSRDYEAIIQDIAKYIYGRTDQTRE